MKKVIFIFTLVLTSSLSIAQNKQVPKKKTQKAFGKIDFLSINMPETTIPNEKNMGFTGIHYNLMLNNWVYAGTGIYGAVTGERGGFFTLGINGGIKKYFGDSFYVDTGFHIGAGGGAGAPDGGGIFVLPHFNLGYDFKDFSLNAGWSYVDFFDKGLIKGNQFNVSLEIPLDYSYSDYQVSEKEYNFATLKNSDWNINAKRTSLMFHQNNLKIRGNTQGNNSGKTIRLAGFEFANYFNKNWFAFLKVDGAFDGIKAGFMDVFLGGGYLLPINKNNTNILAKFGVGAAGGGGIDSQGGFLLLPDVSIEQRVFKDFFISVNAGKVLSPNSFFDTTSYGFGIKYYVERSGIQSDKTFTRGKFKGFEVIVKHDLYLDAERDGNIPTEDLHQIALQINFDLTKNIFVAGQTAFASFGNAGAYAEGILGVGARTNPFLNDKITIFSQVLAGAAGGGDISTGEGLIFKPSVGFNYKLNNSLSLRAAGGYVKAKGGALSSAMFNFGIKYHLSFLKMNK
jgi:hypothetical protein